MAMIQLQIISGIAKGLTRSADSLLVLDESPEDIAEAERMSIARSDPRAVKLREDIFAAIRRTVELWSSDASVCDVSVSCL